MTPADRIQTERNGRSRRETDSSTLFRTTGRIRCGTDSCCRWLSKKIIQYYGDEFEGIPNTYTHQGEQNGLAHALLTAEEQIDDDFMFMFGDNIFQANLEDVVRRHREARADAAFLVKEVPCEEASQYGVRKPKYGKITDVMQKPEEPPSNLVMIGFYTLTTAIFHAYYLVPPSNRGEYEISEAIDLLIQSGRTIDTIGLDGWRIGVGYPEVRDEAERRLESGVEAESGNSSS